MTTKTITVHPFKLTIEFDDEFLGQIGIGQKEIDEIAEELENQMKPICIAMHGAKAQMDASNEMNK